MVYEVRELTRANEIFKLASTFFAQAELDRRLICHCISFNPLCRAWSTAWQLTPQCYARASSKPSSSQPVTPPIISFTGRPSCASFSAALVEPLQ